MDVMIVLPCIANSRSTSMSATADVLSKPDVGSVQKRTHVCTDGYNEEHLLTIKKDNTRVSEKFSSDVNTFLFSARY